MVVRIRLASLLIAICSLGASGQMENVPRYDELVGMFAARFHHSFVDHNHTSTILALQSLLKTDDYLDIQRQTSGKYSENPWLLSNVSYLSLQDMCMSFNRNFSKKCCDDIKITLMSLLLKNMWAITMVDAFGKLPSGLMEGSVFYPGSYDECLSLSPTFETSKTVNRGHKWFNPKYCQIGIHIPKLTSLYNKQGLLTFGMCVPDSCGASDIKYVYDYGTRLIPFWTGDKQNTFVCHEEQKYDAQAIVTLVVCGLIVSLLIIGTLYDVIGAQRSKFPKTSVAAKQRTGLESIEMTVVRPTQNPNVIPAEISTIEQTPKPNVEKDTIKQMPNPNGVTARIEPAHPPRQPGQLGEFLLCFSVYKNTSKLLNTDLPNGNLAPIHGIRFFSMTWIILGHTFVIGALVCRNNFSYWKNLKTFSFQAIGNATVSVDSFFLLSGMLVVYVGLKFMEQEIRWKDWLYFYFHRFWRLTPTYMLVMMNYIPMMQYFGDGPYWPKNDVDANYCRDTWWRNLFYINNLFDEKQCMGWMWYLANDMQFFIASPIILILLNKKPVGGLIVLLLLLIGQSVGIAFIWLSKKRDPTYGYDLELYIRPYTRIGPYLVGMAYGFLLHRINGKMAISNFRSVLLWLLASGCAASILYGLYGNYHDDRMTKEVAAAYWSLQRSGWAIAVGWVVCACVIGNGGIVNTFLSYPPFIPLSRLTYCAYLVHPIVLLSYFLRERNPIYVTNFRVAHIYLANVCFSYLVAFIVSMAFEAPMIALEKLFWRKKNKTFKL